MAEKEGHEIIMEEVRDLLRDAVRIVSERLDDHAREMDFKLSMIDAKIDRVRRDIDEWSAKIFRRMLIASVLFGLIVSIIAIAVISGLMLEHASNNAEQYVQGYIEGVRDALNDPSFSMVKLACMKGENVSITIGREQFKLVCGQGGR
ncbi:MAG: hypothetical protein GSR84_08960 [Desulfurococcales archaeon]|nr:hypothetical protein [Desulfurococcales archaeon]